MYMHKNIAKIAFLHASATIIYIVVLVSLIAFTGSIVDEKMGGEDTILAPIVMLSLLVISATITGFAVFGRPVMWYIDGKKKEAVVLLGWTLGFLICLTLLFASMFLVSMFP